MIKLFLSNLLSERKMTQAELAEKTGIRPSTISEIYHNNCTFLKIENIEKICRVLECELGDLICYLKSSE